MTHRYQAVCDLVDCNNTIALQTNNMSIPETSTWRSVKINLGKGMEAKGDFCCYEHAVTFLAITLEEMVRAGISGLNMPGYTEALFGDDPYLKILELIKTYMEPKKHE